MTLKKNKFLWLEVICFLILISISIYFKFLLQTNVNNKKSFLFISGSSSTQKLCEDLGFEFSSSQNLCRVSKTGSGSSQAIIDIKKNLAQIGDLSRPLSDYENKSLFDIHIIAKDAIAICINKKNKLKNISSVDLKDIFLKKNTNWKKLNGENRKIALIGRDFSSGTRIVFEKYLHSSGKINYDIELENNGKVKYKLQNDEDSIGYLSFSAVDDSLNVLSIDGIEPSFENIKNSKYHIIHPLLQITKKGVKDPIIDAWFSFVFSDKGAAIIKQNRFIPVPKN